LPSRKRSVEDDVGVSDIATSAAVASRAAGESDPDADAGRKCASVRKRPHKVVPTIASASAVAGAAGDDQNPTRRVGRTSRKRVHVGV
jgi:hypothetical protein